jgi:hypothetical protein
MECHHLGMVVEAGDGLVTVEAGPEVPVQRGGSPTSLFDLFRGPHFTLLGLGERCAAAFGHPTVSGDAETDIVKSYRVGPDGLRDDDGHAAHAYGTDALILVRPDGYIGLVADPTQTARVAEYLCSL